jgi:hypothetical protein
MLLFGLSRCYTPKVRQSSESRDRPEDNPAGGHPVCSGVEPAEWCAIGAAIGPAPAAFPMKQVVLTWFVLSLVLFAYTHQGHEGPTAMSRLDLMHGLVTSGTVKINAYHANTPDKASFGGNYFSDKAPGTVALALPGFLVGVFGGRLLGVSLESDRGCLISSWVACAASLGLVAALGAAALLSWLGPHSAPRAALLTCAALFLGAAPLPYATMMFSHALVVGCIAIGVWAVERQRAEAGSPVPEVSNQSLVIAEELSGGGRQLPAFPARWWVWGKRNRWDLLAGFACGWALASEFTAGLVVAGLFFWMVSFGWQRAVPFCLAAMPPLLLIPAYSWSCFGNPFILPYSLNASFPAMKEGLYAIKWPDADTAFNLLFSPARGLFFWTPFLVMAGFGYWELIQTNRRLFWLTYAVPLLQVLVISGRIWDWPAGPTLGPRYLAPMLPLLALPCALGVKRFPRLGGALAAYSILITTLATLTDACPSFPDFPNPLLDLHIPLFLKGEFSPNLGMVLGLSPYASVTVYYAMLIGGIWWLWRKAGNEPSGPETSAAHVGS